MILGRQRNLLRIIPWIPFALFLVSFRQEIVVFMKWIKWGKDLDVFVRSLIWGQPPIPSDVSHAFTTLIVNIGCFVVLFFVWLLFVANQTIFPVTKLREVILTAIYLILHLLGLHGMAAYVRNGKIKAYVHELQRTWPGVVLVDFNSAVAVEQIVLRPGLLRMFKMLFRRLATLLRFNLPPVRIQGAGLIFALPDERIHGVNDLETHPVASSNDSWMNDILGVVDLRTQFRISARQPHPQSKRLGTSVFAYTRDGIEVKTNIWVLATLGHDPVPYFPLNVTYIGDQHPRNLRVVKFKKISERAGLYRVESITDELDLEDRLEIHQQWQAITTWEPYTGSPRPPITPVFNPSRVFAAVFARARHPRGLDGIDEIVPWIDLPVHVAVDLFREIISHYNYDELYRSDAGGDLVVNRVRGKLAAAMRNSGLLSYRPIFHCSGHCLEEGRMYSADALLTVHPSNAFVLHTPRVLRDRGIRVIASGFGDLVVDERIYKQRMDHWRAAWDQETEIVEAGLEWESIRHRTRARIHAQQEFVQRLSGIYQSNGNSREILALRVLQALEMAAADPKTRQLLPEDTFSMLRSIHDWLLPQDMGFGGTGTGS
jgi:hypothetical protein